MKIYRIEFVAPTPLVATQILQTWYKKHSVEWYAVDMMLIQVITDVTYVMLVVNDRLPNAVIRIGELKTMALTMLQSYFDMDQEYAANVIGFNLRIMEREERPVKVG